MFKHTPVSKLEFENPLLIGPITLLPSLWGSQALNFRCMFPDHFLGVS